jgi:predicted enzyme related to lactoylglutathione lyase
MGLARTYPHGTFCWVELGTPDLEAAKVFYARLFQWTYEDIPAGGEPYTIAKLDGIDVGGLDGHRPEEGYGWQSYVAVHDLPAVLDKARELGGTVSPHSGDLPVASRFAILRDPTGAEVTLWENEGGYHGARLVNEVGTWSWNELVTPDLKVATAFYEGLFGWTSQAVGGPDMDRVSFRLGERLVAGGHAPTGTERKEPRWDIAFRVADVDAAIGVVQQLGGRVVMPPMDVPVGRFAIIGDHDGAVSTLSTFDKPVAGADES